LTVIAISGHRGLPAESTRLVDEALRATIARYAEQDQEQGRGVVAVSCIADGPDSLFAHAVLDVGGSLVVVVPAEQYRDALPAEHHPTYDELLSRAAKVIALDHRESTSQAHHDASLRMLDEATELVAVWDGQPSRSFGGTADVVDAARERGMPVQVVWPDGAERD
jgi:hypothetical protein